MLESKVSFLKLIWLKHSCWIALILIVLFGAVLRLVSYPLGLPYVDNPDEPYFYVFTGVEESEFAGALTYPPAYRAMYAMLHQLTDSSPLPPSAQVNLMRQLSVLVSSGCILLAALIAQQAAGPAAGLLAGALIAVEPNIIRQSSYALPDAYVAFFAAAALLGIVFLYRTEHRYWIYISGASILLAVTFKYHALPLVPVILALPLVYRPLHGLRRYWRDTLIAGGLVALGLIGLFFIYGGAQSAVIHIDHFTIKDDTSMVSNLPLPSLQTFIESLTLAVGEHELAAIIALVGLVIGGVLLVQRRDSIEDVAPWPLFALFATTILFLLALSILRTQPYRRLYPLVVMLAAIGGVGLSAYFHLLRAIVPARLQQMSALGLGAAMLLMLAPTANMARHQALSGARTDHRVDLMRWADSTLPSGPYLAGDVDYHKVFNRAWGGYQGETDFALHEVASLVSEPIAVWREAGVQYAVIPYGAYQQLFEYPEIGQPYLDETLLLKAFPPSPDRRGPPTAVLRLYPVQHSTAVNFGNEIELVGYDFRDYRVQPGDAIMVAHFWRAPTTPSGNYKVYNHLAPLDSREIIAQADGWLQHSTARPTSTWDDPDEVFIGQAFRIEIGQDVPPGAYRLLTGVYDSVSGQRLPVITEDGTPSLDYTTLTQVTIQ